MIRFTLRTLISTRQPWRRWPESLWMAAMATLSVRFPRLAERLDDAVFPALNRWIWRVSP